MVQKENLCWTDMIENSYSTERRTLAENKENLLKDDASADFSKVATNGIVYLKNTDNSGLEKESAEEKAAAPKNKTHANVKSKVEEKEQEEATLVISLQNNMMALANIIKAIDVSIFSLLENYHKVPLRYEIKSHFKNI